MRASVVGAGNPLDRCHDPGRRLVVGPGVGVDAGLGLGLGPGARVGREHGRLLQERRRAHCRRELRRELAERQVLAALADQVERRHVPEGGGAAVAEDHLVAVGQREQLGQPLSHPAHHGAHPLLPVGGAEVRRTRRRERVESLDPHLARPGAEPAVRGGADPGGS